MKKLLAILSMALLALTACTDSTSAGFEDFENFDHTFGYMLYISEDNTTTSGLSPIKVKVNLRSKDQTAYAKILLRGYTYEGYYAYVEDEGSKGSVCSIMMEDTLLMLMDVKEASGPVAVLIFNEGIAILADSDSDAQLIYNNYVLQSTQAQP